MPPANVEQALGSGEPVPAKERWRNPSHRSTPVQPRQPSCRARSSATRARCSTPEPRARLPPTPRRPRRRHRAGTRQRGRRARSAGPLRARLLVVELSTRGWLGWPRSTGAPGRADRRRGPGRRASPRWGGCRWLNRPLDLTRLATSDVPADRREWVGGVDAVGPGVHALLEVGCECRVMRGQPPQRVAE